MADLKTKLTLDGSDFTRGMNEAAKSVEDFTDASQMSASELLNQMKSMDKLGRSTGNYRSQLAQITRQIQDLTINYRAMSDEMKNSDFGQAVAAKIQELTAKAGEFKDAIIDAQASVRALSSDTAGWDAMKQGIEGVSAGLQVFVASGVLGEKSTEKLVAVLAKLKAMEAATNAVIKIGNLLQKQSALMMGISKVQAISLSRAKELETAATGKATVAQRLFNVVAKANPYVLLATAVIAVVSALAAFAIASDKAKKKEEELQRQNEKTEKQYDKYASTVGSSIGKVVSSFKALQLQWNNLKTEAEKKKWIDDNTEAFRQLGLKVTDVNSAQQIFVNQSEAVLTALKAQARASGLMDLYKQYEQDIVNAKIEIDKKVALAQNTVKAGDKKTGRVMPAEWAAAGLSEYSGDVTTKATNGYDGGSTIWTLTQQGAEKYYAYVRQQNQYLVRDAEQAADYVTTEWEKAEKEAQAAMEKVNNLVVPANNDDNKPKNPKPTPTKQEVEVHYTKGSYAEAQAMVTQLQTDLNNMSFDDPGFGLVVAALDQWKQKAQEIKDAMSIVNAEIKKTPGSYAEAAAMVSMLSRELQNLDPNTSEFRMVKFELESWQETLDEIKAAMETTKEEAEELAKVDPFEKWKNGLSTLGNLESSFSGIYSSIKNVGEAFEDCEDPLDALFSTIDNILSLLNNVTTVLEIINTLEQISVATQLAKDMAEKQETQEKIKQAVLNTTNLSTEQAEAIAASVKAAADAGSSASKIPVVGWVLAIGAIAAIIAAISAAKSSVNFAGGGIVPGSSYAGDFVNAKLNSGEMVLNKQQQQRLFNMLDANDNNSNGKVEFIIKGQDLKGVLNNYDKKMSRV